MKNLLTALLLLAPLCYALTSCTGKHHGPGTHQCDTAAIVRNYLKEHHVKIVDLEHLEHRPKKPWQYNPPTPANYSKWLEKGTPELTNTANGMVNLYLENVVERDPYAYKSIFVKASDIQKMLTEDVTDIQITFGLGIDNEGMLYNTYMFCGVNSVLKKHVYVDNKVLEHCLPCPNFCAFVPNDFYE